MYNRQNHFFEAFFDFARELSRSRMPPTVSKLVMFRAFVVKMNNLSTFCVTSKHILSFSERVFVFVLKIKLLWT